MAAGARCRPSCVRACLDALPGCAAFPPPRPTAPGAPCLCMIRAKTLPYAPASAPASQAFDLDLRGGGRVRFSEVAFWMEALGQLLETAQWAPQPLALCIDGASTLNRRVLAGMCPKHLVALRVHGAGVCDELLQVIERLPVVASVALTRPTRGLSRTGLAALAGTRTLTDLALTWSNMCDVGAASLQRLTKLVSLDVSGSRALSDQGAKVLIAKGHGHLKCVSLLDASRVTARALVEIGIFESGLSCCS